MSKKIQSILQNGLIKDFEGIPHIFYDNYWIRYYEPPNETLAEKKKLLDALTRRTFHHTEPGINTPGDKLEKVRLAYERESEPRKKRVNAAMLAGALFNRATDIFTTIVNLEEKGIVVTEDDDLMLQCAECLTEALSFSNNVKHHSGEEGVDELWGEPVKVFTMSIGDYYHSRYRKVAQAMNAIDTIGDTMKTTLCNLEWFKESEKIINDFIEIAKKKSEILTSDPDYFSVWPEFVANEEKIDLFKVAYPQQIDYQLKRYIDQSVLLLCNGKNLINWIANVRVPMPVSTQKYSDSCAEFCTKIKSLPHLTTYNGQRPA